MSQTGLERFGGYQKARQLFYLVVNDMGALKTNPLCYRLVSQQMGSADSICANIEEGYGRLSRVEYGRFLDIARGAARETRGRYERMSQWLDNKARQTTDRTDRRDNRDFDKFNYSNAEESRRGERAVTMDSGKPGREGLSSLDTRYSTT